jgi:hypothetical protein
MSEPIFFPCRRLYGQKFIIADNVAVTGARIQIPSEKKISLALWKLTPVVLSLNSKVHIHNVCAARVNYTKWSIASSFIQKAQEKVYLKSTEWFAFVAVYATCVILLCHTRNKVNICCVI